MCEGSVGERIEYKARILNAGLDTEVGALKSCGDVRVFPHGQISLREGVIGILHYIDIIGCVDRDDSISCARYGGCNLVIKEAGSVLCWRKEDERK